MYRQILLHCDDRDFQRIFWRKNETDQIKEFRLNTVTYGLTCAPFLAIRTLHQLVKDEGHRFPEAASALLHDTYMDDILTGSDTIPDLEKLIDQLITLCRAGGFPLQKWISNAVEINDGFDEGVSYSVSVKQEEGPEVSHPTLGLRWSPVSDQFFYQVIPAGITSSVTKRTMLSQAAKLFDPLGWLSPVTVRAKIEIQSTWLLGIGWDDPLPEMKSKDWQRFQQQLPEIESIRVPRKLTLSYTHDKLELHGFCDASERAYSAVVYLRSFDNEAGPFKVSLIIAKTKVAPLKRVSLPRLELCGSLLLARLVGYVRAVLGMSWTSIHLWTDSTVALGWIRGHPSRWKTYVANRVTEIQRLTADVQWHHIKGSENPADPASRGIWPSDAAACELWWRGPLFLYRSLADVSNDILDTPTDELKEHRAIPLNAMMAITESNPVLTRFSSYNRLLRVTAWCRRWRRCAMRRNKDAEVAKQKTELEVDELIQAENLWIRLEQEVFYSTEKRALQSGRSIPKGSSLLKFTPYLDDGDLLRVGGRLKHSLLSFDEMHPIILPPKSHYTKLYISSVHRKFLHAGVQSTLAIIRQRFWIPTGRRVVKNLIHQCTACIRWRAARTTQIMADLPSCRVNQFRPFLHTGLDYAGPVMLRTSPGRGHKSVKAFLVIFVCMTTRAVHLDVASDYSAGAFLAAFRRFVSRRGLCSDLYSDRGTNFRGADSELRRLFAARSKELTDMKSQIANQRVKWHFNAPAAPHHGGLWEAAVKSTKSHLRRVIGDRTLTYEEMATLLAQVEAVLNSRPLAACSDDPNDMTALTPGHALIGAPLTALPEPSLLDVNEYRLSRWQLLVQIRDRFWERWKREYLHGLIQRQKWPQSNEDVRIGQLCLITNELTSPACWPLARIMKVHPSSDGHVRVCTLKTATTELVRPIVRLVLLPLAASVNS